MADDTDYEFIPKATLEDMKKQIAELQRQIQQKEKISVDQFSQAIAKLTQSMEEMNELFRAATEELKIEEDAGQRIDEYIEPLNKRLNAIEDQNKKIADAMLALADMINDLKEQKQAPEQPQMPPSYGQRVPPMQQEIIRAPLPPRVEEEPFPQELPSFEQPQMSPQMGAPLPPPPTPPKKKHLFSFKK